MMLTSLQPSQLAKVKLLPLIFPFDEAKHIENFDLQGKYLLHDRRFGTFRCILDPDKLCKLAKSLM